MKNRFLQTIFISMLLIGCSGNDIYFQYNPVAVKGWSKDTAYVFNVPVSDTTATYNVYVNIRNRSEYPYQNLWLFLKKISPDTIQTKDSIECYLADQRGKWLGTGMGSIMEMPVLYQQNVRFNKAGTYRYEIVQGMRDTMLI